MIEIKNGSYSLKKKIPIRRINQKFVPRNFFSHFSGNSSKYNNEKNLFHPNKSILFPDDIFNFSTNDTSVPYWWEPSRTSESYENNFRIDSSEKLRGSAQKNSIQRQDVDEPLGRFSMRKKNITTKNDNFEIDTSFRAGEDTAGYIVSIKSSQFYLNIFENPTIMRIFNTHDRETNFDPIHLNIDPLQKKLRPQTSFCFPEGGNDLYFSKSPVPGKKKILKKKSHLHKIF